jgi:hypothetical protein
LSGEEHGRPDGMLNLSPSAVALADWGERADTKEKGSLLPRPRTGIRFCEGCLLIAALILASPGMILLTIAGLFERPFASNERFVRRLSKNRRRTRR